MCKEIKKWISLGDRIILAISINEHVFQGELACKLADLGLEEVIISKHAKGDFFAVTH